MRNVHPNVDEALTDSLRGHYANCFQVGHNAFEFLIDFGQLSADAQRSSFHSRVIVTPASAKMLTQLLEQSIKQFEASFGQIQDCPPDQS
jgi:hypothetical protein